MKGWILYKRCTKELTQQDHGVNRLIETAAGLGIQFEVYNPEQFSIDNFSKTILINGNAVELPDFVIPRLGADTTFIALSIIRQLEFAGVYMFNGSASIDLVKDKMLVSQLLATHNLPTPKTILLTYPVSTAIIERELGFPVVVKSVSGARGIGVYLCETLDRLTDFVGFFDSQSAPMVAQQFIQTSYGRDLRVFVLGDQVVGCMQRTARVGFKANYSLGGEVCSFELTEEIESLALAAARLCNLEICGIDLLFSPEGYIICEANSSPGFKGLEAAINKDIAREILSYIVSKIKNRA